MNLKITRLQLLGTTNLVSNLKDITSRGLATIKGLRVLYNSRTPNYIYVQYEKAESHSDQYGFIHVLVSIDKDGNIQSIGDKFVDIFAASSFMSECKDIDYTKMKDYLID